jgi:hypothetical protein
VPVTPGRGYVEIRRKWRGGDLLEVDFPLPIRRIVADGLVQADAGKVALQRGPIVYCAEGVDNGGRALNLALADDEKFSHWSRPDLLGGVAIITGKAAAVERASAGRPAESRRRPFMAIPYFAWASRGAGEMAVWFPRVGADQKSSRPAKTSGKKEPLEKFAPNRSGSP